MSETQINIPQLLTRIPLFQELAEEEINDIVTGCRQRRLSKGEMLFQKGDTPTGFYVVVFGQVKLAFPSAQGNEKVVEVLGPHHSFGEAVMFMARPYPVFAEALMNSLVLHISSNSIFDLLGRDAVFARRMLGGLAIRLHSLVQDVETYSLRSSLQRVIGYLLQLCPDDHAQIKSAEIHLPTPKQVIASRLNLTPETLSRILHELSDNGLISVQGKQITINDLAKLREFDL